MKDLLDVNNARQVVGEAMFKLQHRTADDPQRCILSGMLVALCWVAESSNGTTLQDLIDGRAIFKLAGVDT